MVKIEKVSLSTNSIYNAHPNATNNCYSELALSKAAKTETSEKNLCSDDEQYTDFSEVANSRQPQQVEFDSEVEGDLKLSVANPNLLKLAYQDHKLNKANPTLALDQANIESGEAESKLANAQQTKNAPPIIKGKVMGLTFNVLLDPCSTGSEGYIINYVLIFGIQ